MRIYTAAMENHNDFVDEIHSVPGCLHQWFSGQYFFSAASRLALEGEWEALNKFLQMMEENERDGYVMMNYIHYGAALGGHREPPLKWKKFYGKDASINWKAMGAAQSNHREWAKQLLIEGANINWVAQGAALGKHRTWAEELVREGANLNCIAVAAAMIKDREWAQELQTKGANIDCIAVGVGMIRDREWSKELRNAGANVNYIAAGAAMGGDLEWAEELHKEGAEIRFVAYGAVHSGNLHSYPVERQLQFLLIHRRVRFPFLNLPPNKTQTITLAPKNLRRGQLLEKELSQNQLSFRAALWKTDPNNHRFLLMLTHLFISGQPQLPKDIWLYIFSFLNGTTLNRKEAEQLAFTTAKFILTNSLKKYLAGKTKHAERAGNFLKTITVIKKLPSLTKVLLAQAERLRNPDLPAEGKEKHEQPLNNKAVDGYHTIIGLWANRFTPNPAPYLFEDKENGHTICSIS